ncbi:MAG: hypothetical protein KAS59_02110 [Alphaproteobacteria bacterium]|nr:hypothetical protein [Alphaproteobacteria bacterium]
MESDIVYDDWHAETQTRLARSNVYTAQMLSILELNDIYRSEYNRFVKGVSYTLESDILNFDTTVTALKALVDRILQTKI